VRGTLRSKMPGTIFCFRDEVRATGIYSTRRAAPNSPSRNAFRFSYNQRATLAGNRKSTITIRSVTTRNCRSLICINPLLRISVYVPVRSRCWKSVVILVETRPARCQPHDRFNHRHVLQSALAICEEPPACSSSLVQHSQSRYKYCGIQSISSGGVEPLDVVKLAKEPAPRR